jgi:integrase
MTAAEVEKLIGAARSSRYAHRDATLIFVGYRHGLRASEIADLEWSQPRRRAACSPRQERQAIGPSAAR